MVTLSYIFGIVSVMIFTRFRSKEAAPEAHVQYESRIREIEDVLVDLRIGLDTLEIRSGDASQPLSQQTQQASDVGHMQTPIPVVSKPSIRRALEQEGIGMVDYVLKLLVEGPKTSRQIEGLIGRSREHTARLMKKMFEMGYVTRDMSSKPYTYSITDSGRTTLQQVAVSA